MSHRYTIDGKERKNLRGRFQGLPATFHLGRRGLENEWYEAVDDALRARELVKVKIGKNVEMDPSELAYRIGARLKAEVVGIIGRFVLLYRPLESDTDG